MSPCQILRGGTFLGRVGSRSGLLWVMLEIIFDQCLGSYLDRFEVTLGCVGGCPRSSLGQSVVGSGDHFGSHPGIVWHSLGQIGPNSFPLL